MLKVNKSKATMLKATMLKETIVLFICLSSAQVSSRIQNRATVLVRYVLK
jgi:hypothetical protein